MILFLSQFLLGGYTTPYRLDRLDLNGGEILVFIREDIPSIKLRFSEAGHEGFFIKLNLRKSRWLECFSYNTHEKQVIWVLLGER